MTENNIVYIEIVVTPDNIEKKEYICNEQDCGKDFTNEQSLRKHINLIHHQITAAEKKIVYQYSCPVETCRRRVHKDFLSSRKYLIQHFYKAHNSEKFNCRNGCDKKFSTELLRNVHEKSCGKVFSCDFCNCCYSSNEALLTHRKRKNHIDPSIETKKKKQKTEKSNTSVGTITSLSKSTAIDDELILTQIASKAIKNSSTSTSDDFMKEENSNSLSSSSSQNKKNTVSWNMSGEFEEDSSTLFDSAETQTDFTESLFGSNFMNNFTQTTFTDFDDFEKFDSQTQTNWDD